MENNCTYEAFVGDVAYSYFILNCITSVLGCLGNILSLSCLWNCQTTDYATKINLGTLFSTQLIISLVSLPGDSLGWYLKLSCNLENLPLPWRLLFMCSHSTLLPFERLNFAAMAVFRFIAVRWPHNYNEIVRVPVIIVMEVVFLVYAIIPVLIAIRKGVNNALLIEYELHDASSTVNMLRGYENLFPTLTSLVSCILFFHTTLKRQRELSWPTPKNTNARAISHVTTTIMLIIFINLVLDVPHIIVHLSKVDEVPLLIVHNIYYTHIVIDAIIFVAMNPRYRNELLAKKFSCFREGEEKPKIMMESIV